MIPWELLKTINHIPVLNPTIFVGFERFLALHFKELFIPKRFYISLK